MAGKKGVKHTNRMLRDYRTVYRMPDHVPGETRALKALRDLFEKDPGAFMDRLAKLEAQHGGGANGKRSNGKPVNGVPVAAGAPGEPDIGLERALGVCNRLLREFNAKEAREDAEFARRPDAAALGASLQNRLKGALEREQMLLKRVAELESRLQGSGSRDSGSARGDAVAGMPGPGLLGG